MLPRGFRNLTPTNVFTPAHAGFASAVLSHNFSVLPPMRLHNFCWLYFCFRQCFRTASATFRPPARKNVLPRKLTRGFRDLTPTRLFTPELTPMLPPRFRHASARRGITSFASANASAQLPPPYARHVWRMPQSSRASAEFCPRPYVNVREGVFDAGHMI